MPPFTALRAFVATARHLSFSAAADELHVTTSAIGQQVRLLEEHLGQPLFLRVKGQLKLTEAGRALVPGLSEALDGMVRALALLDRADDIAPLRVSVAPSFAGKWLIPRLARLREVVPGLAVQIDSTPALADVAGDEIDCVVRYGRGAYPGLVVDHLFGEAVLPVCSPDFAREHALWGNPGAISAVPVLHEDGDEQDPTCPDWASWLRSEGLPASLVQGGIAFTQSALVIDAAIAGQGLGLAKLKLAELDLEQGRLVTPFGRARPVEFSYWFATTPNKAATERVALFRDWLLDEAERDVLQPAASSLRPAAEIRAVS